MNELEAKSRNTEVISEANEATTLTLNERMASLEKELRNLSIDETGLEGGLIFFGVSTMVITLIFLGKTSSLVVEEIRKLENYTRHGIAEIQQGTFEMVQSNQVI